MMNISKIDTSVSKVAELSAQLSLSLKKPGRKTLTLINKALSYLTPFEVYGKQAFRPAATPAERQDLLALLDSHRMVLTPYLDVDRIESNLRRPAPY
ncbi:MAG: hypothetical protein K2L22_07530 [Muribaculaceae bacterium]|nr:hypothetical protein [Muribaculaceae bacterium]